MTDPLDRQAERLTAIYRRLPRPEPSAALDAAVLSHARAALYGRRPRWLAPVSAAAVVVLAAGLAWQFRQHAAELEPLSPAPMNAPAEESGRVQVAPAQPAPTPAVPVGQTAATEERPAAAQDRAATTAQATTPRARDASGAADQAPPPPAAEPAPPPAAAGVNQMAPAPAAPPAPLSSVSSAGTAPPPDSPSGPPPKEDRSAPGDMREPSRRESVAEELEETTEADAAPILDAREASTIPAPQAPAAALERANERAAGDDLTAKQAQRLDEPLRLQAAPAPPEPTQAPGAAPTDAERQVAREGQAAASAPQPSVDALDEHRSREDKRSKAEVPASATPATAAPQEWLARIRELFEAGEHDAARESLREFQAAFPREPIPDDLRALLPP